MVALALDMFPQPHDDDHEDVETALTVAEASWRRGDGPDALKWLRRAAQAAADADDVMRALELSKIAARIDIELEHGAPSRPGKTRSEVVPATPRRPTSSVPPRAPSRQAPPARPLPQPRASRPVAPPTSRPTSRPPGSSGPLRSVPPSRSSAPPAPSSASRLSRPGSAPPRPASAPPRPGSAPPRPSRPSAPRPSRPSVAPSTPPAVHRAPPVPVARIASSMPPASAEPLPLRHAVPEPPRREAPFDLDRRRVSSDLDLEQTVPRMAALRDIPLRDPMGDVPPAPPSLALPLVHEAPVSTVPRPTQAMAPPPLPIIHPEPAPLSQEPPLSQERPVSQEIAVDMPPALPPAAFAPPFERPRYEVPGLIGDDQDTDIFPALSFPAAALPEPPRDTAFSLAAVAAQAEAELEEAVRASRLPPPPASDPVAAAHEDESSLGDSLADEVFERMPRDTERPPGLADMEDTGAMPAMSFADTSLEAPPDIPSLAESTPLLEAAPATPVDDALAEQAPADDAEDGEAAVATSPRMELVHSRPSADEPVETHETAVAPEEESPISASRSGSFPSIHDDCPPEPSTPMPLSAARIAVMPDERGRPQVQFLPFGQAAPEGAVTAMLVTTNAHEAARLAEMIARATEQDLRSAGT